MHITKKSLSKVLVLREGESGSSLDLLHDSKQKGDYLATWDSKSFNTDEVNKLKGYISGNSITTFCITFVHPIDYKNGLKPLFKGVVSQSSTIGKLCININSIAEPELTSKYFKKLLSCAIKSLHKSGGQYSKNIYIGSDNNNHINTTTFEKILKAISEVNKNTKLESKTHYLKLLVVVGNDFKKSYDKYKEKYSQKILFKLVSHSPSSTNVKLKNIIEFSQVPCDHKPNICKQICNKIIRNIISNKSAYEEEDTNASISTTDNQDSLQDNVVLGDAQSTIDDVCL